MLLGWAVHGIQFFLLESGLFGLGSSFGSIVAHGFDQDTPVLAMVVVVLGRIVGFVRRRRRGLTALVLFIPVVTVGGRRLWFFRSAFQRVFTPVPAYE